MSATKNNPNGIKETVKGRKPRLSVYVDNYLKKNGNRIHQADIDVVIATLQKLQGLKPAPVVEPTPTPSVPVDGVAAVVETVPAEAPAVS